MRRMTAANVLTSAEFGNDNTDSIRRAHGLSLRRLGLAILLRNVEALGRDVPSGDWIEERKDFYALVKNHVLRPDLIFEQIDYTMRVLGLSVGLRDWNEANSLVKYTLESIRWLRKHGSSSSEFRINGHTGSNLSISVWSHFASGLARQATEVILRNAPTDYQTNEIASLMARLRLRNRNEGQNNTGIEQRIELLRRHDWARIPYKELLRSQGTLGVGRYKAWESCVEPFNDLEETLKAFYERAKQAEAGHWLAPALMAPGLDDSVLAQCFYPTRPYTVAEFARHAPQTLHSNGREELIQFVRAIRGVWIKDGNHTASVGKGIPPRNPSPKETIELGSLPERGISLGISSIRTDESSWSAAAAGTPNWSLDRYRQFERLISQVAHLPRRPTFLLLPELSLPERWLATVAGRLMELGVGLIAGLEYSRNGSGDVKNEAVMVLPTDMLGYRTWIEIRQRKGLPAPGEEFDLLHRFGIKLAAHYKPESRPIYRYNNFQFGLLICSELQNIGFREYFQGDVDCMMILSWNRDLETFSALVDSAALDVHAYIALVNNRTYGDSRVRAPMKERFRRDLCQLRGGTNDQIAIVELNIESLRKFQSRAKRWPLPDDDFKPVPEGFDMATSRRDVPR